MENYKYVCKVKCFYRHNTNPDPEGKKGKRLYKKGEVYMFREDHVPSKEFVDWFEPYPKGKMIPNDPRAKTVKEK